MTYLAWLYLWRFFHRRDLHVSKLNELESRVLADGSIDDAEVELLRRELYGDGKIDQEEVEFLISLRSKAKTTCPAFEQLFFSALKENLLVDGSIDAAEATWLRKMLFADGQIDAAEKQFLTELHTQARQVCPEFQQLFDECMKR